MILALKVLLVTVLNQNIIKKYPFFTTLIQSFKHSNCGVGKLFGEVRESKVGCRHRVHHHHHIFCIIHTSICWSYKHGIIAFTEIHILLLK